MMSGLHAPYCSSGTARDYGWIHHLGIPLPAIWEGGRLLTGNTTRDL